MGRTFLCHVWGTLNSFSALWKHVITWGSVLCLFSKWKLGCSSTCVPWAIFHVCRSLPLTDTHLSAESVFCLDEPVHCTNSPTHFLSCHSEDLPCFHCDLFGQCYSRYPPPHTFSRKCPLSHFKKAPTVLSFSGGFLTLIFFPPLFYVLHLDLWMWHWLCFHIVNHFTLSQLKLFEQVQLKTLPISVNTKIFRAESTSKHFISCFVS